MFSVAYSSMISTVIVDFERMRLTVSHFLQTMTGSQIDYVVDEGQKQGTVTMRLKLCLGLAGLRVGD